MNLCDGLTDGRKRSLQELIQRRGCAIAMAEFMALVSYCHEASFYQTTSDITADFITMPELTPIFGYLIGWKLASVYNKHFTGRNIFLIELGPGSGKLMFDMLRYISTYNPLMSSKLRIGMVEVSNSLREIQRSTLNEFNNIEWYKTIPEMPRDSVLFFVANEFFDALPIYQFMLTERGMKEICVTVRDGVMQKCIHDIVSDHAFHVCAKPSSVGDITEVSLASVATMDIIASDIKKHGGYCLFFDYGYTINEYVDTIRIIKRHGMVDFCDADGADISAFVDFGSLIKVAERHVKTSVVHSQYSILQKWGLNEIIQQVHDGRMLEEKIKAMRHFKAFSIFNYDTL